MIRRLLRQKGNAVIQPGFRLRGTEVSRLEGLSDAVIGFALTLLVVSLEVPQTFDELLNSIRGFAAFAICFGLLIIIWFEHDTFFRRYALQQSNRLGLTPLEMFDTRASLYENLSAVLVGFVSILIVVAGGAESAGWVYLVMFPLTWLIKRRNAIQRREIATSFEPATSIE